MKPNYTILNDIVKVKNATLIYDYNKDVYSLVHYDTEIAVITKNGEILKALKCSNTSTKAILQLTNWLGIDQKIVKKNLKPYTNFVKYKPKNLEIDQ